MVQFAEVLSMDKEVPIMFLWRETMIRCIFYIILFLSLSACGQSSELTQSSKKSPEEEMKVHLCGGKIDPISSCMQTRFESWECIPTRAKSVERVIEQCAGQHGQKTIAFGGEESCFFELGAIAERIGSGLPWTETCDDPDGLY